MIRRRGISLLTTVLVFLAFAVFTIIRLPGPSYGAYDDVEAERAAPAEPLRGAGTPVKSAQQTLEEGWVVVETNKGPSVVENSEGTGLVEDSDGTGAANVEDTRAPTPDAETVLVGSPAHDGTANAPTEIATAPDENPTGGKTTDDTPHIPTTLDVHPIAQLVQKANEEAAALLARQSTTLEAAVAEYKRRYSMPPPPHFDKWFAFAQARNISLVDEFDTVHQMLTPFWGLKPATIRKRAAEALGYGNDFMGVLVRNGRVALQTGRREWEKVAMREMMAGFVEWVPDVDLVINALDEPRVVLQHGDLSRLVERGLAAQGRSARIENPANSFSKRPKDMTDGRAVPEVSTTRFVDVRQQSPWSIARMSCPPDSPARALDLDLDSDSDSDDKPGVDDESGYCHRSATGGLCFVSNTTAQTDVCSSPSLATTHGFLDRPNRLSVSHDLVPIFSPSKISSFQDIVFPAPWYWAGRVPYNASADVPWDDKEAKVFWRGSTTGGFSRWGGWRRHHRQRAVQRLNNPKAPATVLLREGNANETGGEVDGSSEGKWEALGSSVGAHAHLFNVSFSHVGQCDPGDCAAERHALPMAEHTPQHAAWSYKLLLDMDGNAFSGRFQAFLRSRSLVLKVALFREWTGGASGWLRPWRDYVPLSLGGGEWVEAARYLAEDEEGKKVAEGIAAGKGVGREEMEVWLFRLLLEYARVVDDDREKIGFSLDGR
ncbi:related to capsular associated protein [Cephalotrichum gorgonifer]|uniref:Related to capsular associated protein n=1 Tax=Cephalotrichum gorgonifer TaxID=2041049 RepID=A0AAE8SX94_9PEZI|nr:related to capsular associated protein [Cephalotrichum gorgonifer]